jgi:hypothetical protein
MKDKLDLFANIVVIIVGLVWSTIFVRNYFFAAPSGFEPFKPGEFLGEVPGTDWSKHDRTLVIALKIGCTYCEQSMPFYRKLSEMEANTQLVVVFPDKKEAVENYLAMHKLRIRAISGLPLKSLKVGGTPTLILLDGNGRVLRSWAGLLSARGEEDVLKHLTAPERSSVGRPLRLPLKQVLFSNPDGPVIRDYSGNKYGRDKTNSSVWRQRCAEHCGQSDC